MVNKNNLINRNHDLEYLKPAQPELIFIFH